MYRARLALVTFTVAAFLVGCGRLIPASGADSVGQASPTTSPPASPTASPQFRPGSGSLSGRIVRLVPGGLVVNSADHEVEVDLKLVVDVWKETSVPASALELGDDLFINGTAGAPFVARSIYANIGRIDGVIRAIDATGLLIEVRLRSGGSVLQRVNFSAYMEYGSPDGQHPVTRADLVVGRAIGAVIYGRPAGQMRATRIWIW